MPLKTQLKNEISKAETLATLLQQFRSSIAEMATNVPNDNYNAVIIFPAAMNQMQNTVQRLNSEGMTFSKLAVRLENHFGYTNASADEANYNEVITLSVSLRNWIISKATEFRHTITNEGIRVYNQPISPNDKTELQNRLTALLALFE